MSNLCTQCLSQTGIFTKWIEMYPVFDVSPHSGLSCAIGGQIWAICAHTGSPKRVYLQNGLKCTLCLMYHHIQGYHAHVIRALTAFLQRVNAKKRMLRELCLPVFRLHTQGKAAMHLKDLLVAECIAMHIMFDGHRVYFSGLLKCALVGSADQNMQRLFDSVFESMKVRNICFIANNLDRNDGTKDCTLINEANRGRTIHCFACHRLDDHGESMYMKGCKNLRWVQCSFLTKNGHCGHVFVQHGKATR